MIKIVSCSIGFLEWLRVEQRWGISFLYLIEINSTKTEGHPSKTELCLVEWVELKDAQANQWMAAWKPCSINKTGSFRQIWYKLKGACHYVKPIGQGSVEIPKENGTDPDQNFRNLWHNSWVARDVIIF